jgi:glutamyl-tRNA synthetase
MNMNASQLPAGTGKPSSSGDKPHASGGKPIRVRFAPSPTGYLHIGGARTALFNYFFARHYGGRFLLRIEDTDTARSSEEMTLNILDSLRWLGLDWDGEPVYQSRRLDRHVGVCDELVSKGRAYPCFCTAEEIASRRDGNAFGYDRHCLNLAPDQAAEAAASGRPYAVRFRVPDGETAFEDAVHGRIAVQNREVSDFVILRSDRTPVYQIAVVVDDHDMGITQVIRGDDHMSNTPKQILLYRAMGWEEPAFAHVPMILGPDKKKLSKRHGATSVEEYRRSGFLPEALANFLSLLGWNPGDDREIMTQGELIRAFDLDGVSKKSAVFDDQKLEWMNSQYIMKTDGDRLIDLIQPYLAESNLIAPQSPQDRDYLKGVIRLLRERAKRLPEFEQKGAFFFRDPETYDAEAVRKNWPVGSVQLFEEVVDVFFGLSPWTTESLEAAIRVLSEQKGVHAGKIIHPIRIALTGSAASPGLFEVMALLGKETVIRRIRRAIVWMQEKT